MDISNKQTDKSLDLSLIMKKLNDIEQKQSQMNVHMNQVYSNLRIVARELVKINEKEKRVS